MDKTPIEFSRTEIIFYSQTSDRLGFLIKFSKKIKKKNKNKPNNKKLNKKKNKKKSKTKNLMNKKKTFNMLKNSLKVHKVAWMTKILLEILMKGIRILKTLVMKKLQRKNIRQTSIIMI